MHVAHGTDWLAVFTLVGTIAAAGGAIVAGTIAALAYKRQTVTFRQQQADRHREHAARVSVRKATMRLETGTPGRGPGPLVAGAEISNASEESVHQSVVLFVDPSTREVLATSHPIDTLPPGEPLPVLAAGATELTTRLLTERPDGYAVEVTFVDRNGLRWHRDWRGGLTETSTQPEMKRLPRTRWETDREGNSFEVLESPETPARDDPLDPT